MELVINVSALDKTNSAVVSASDRTPVADLEMLTVGNVEPFVVSFCDSTGASPAWVIDAGTVVTVAVGMPSVDGSMTYAAQVLTIDGTTRVGALDLDTVAIRQACSTWNICRCHGRNGVWMTMEVRYVTTVALAINAAESVGLLSVFVALPVLAYT